MSLLLSRLSKPALGVRRSPSLSLRLLSNGFSSSLLQKQTPPCAIISAYAGKLSIFNATDDDCTTFEKNVPKELVDCDPMVKIGASNGWVANLNDDGIWRLQDDLNPYASYTHPKRISLPPLVTLLHCQTQLVTNVAMSASSPEDEDCVVAVKFLGPQLSFCRPAQRNPKWVNIRIQNTCFYSSRVMFSKKDNMFRIPGSGGHLIGSWDLNPNPNHNFQKLQFRNLPKLTKTKRELLSSCSTSQHLVESQSTGETFLVKLYKQTANISNDGMAKMKTKALMVFKLDEEGNAVYTQDIGDLCIFLSKSEPFCVPASSFPGLDPNRVEVFDVDEIGSSYLSHSSVISRNATFQVPYHIPPQKID